MTKPATFRQADIARCIRGALAGGLPAGSFAVEIGDGTVRILPIAANSPVDVAQDDERRMREAFGE